MEDPTLESLIAGVEAADPDGARAYRVRARLDALTKPPGSLGRLEALALKLAVAQRRDTPSAARKRILVFAADHGVCAEGVSAYFPEVTAQLCHAYCAGGGVVNVLARRAGAETVVVDVGVDADLSHLAGIRHAKVGRGTRNVLREDAMTAAEALHAIRAGAAAVQQTGAADVIAMGEVGIGNTTVAAALASVLTGAPAERTVGRGTGVGDEALARKRGIVEAAAARCGDGDPLEALRTVGGHEFGALAGAMLAAAAQGSAVLLDGYATAVAALLAARLAPSLADYLVASHRSAEWGHALVLDRLGLEPLIEWDLRLGEGSGAALVLPLLESACALLAEVATFAEAGVEPSLDPRGIA